MLLFSSFIGKSSKKDSSPVSSNIVAEKATHVANDAVDAQLVPIEVVAAQMVSAAPKESPKHTVNKEKSNKKKRNDALLIQQLGNFHIIQIASTSLFMLICVLFLALL